jgi:hypothetical protein
MRTHNGTWYTIKPKIKHNIQFTLMSTNLIKLTTRNLKNKLKKVWIIEKNPFSTHQISIQGSTSLEKKKNHHHCLTLVPCFNVNFD